MLSTSEINKLAKAVSPAITEALKQQQDEILTIEKAAVLLGTSVTALYRRVSRKQVPFKKVHRRVYFSKNELLKYYIG